MCPKSNTRQKTAIRARSHVRAITGESFEPDVVTQDDLERLADLQEVLWLAARSAQKAANLIESRIENGAKVESGNFCIEEFMQIRRPRISATSTVQ